jgi:hypothetical protein
MESRGGVERMYMWSEKLTALPGMLHMTVLLSMSHHHNQHLSHFSIDFLAPWMIKGERNLQGVSSACAYRMTIQNNQCDEGGMIVYNQLTCNGRDAILAQHRN